MGCDCENNETKETLSRRSFLSKLSVGIGAIIGTVLAFPLITAMLDPVTRETGKKWRQIGMASNFEEGNTQLVTFKNASPYKWSGKIAQSAAYIRKEENGEFVAFSVNCSHLGCPVRWEEKPGLFMCPCHGGVYYKDGSRAAGPPPRGLYKYPVRISGEHLEIQTDEIPITDITA